MEDLPRVLVAPREILVMHLQLLAMFRNYLLIHVGAMPTDLPARFWWKLCWVKSEWAKKWHDLLKMTGIKVNTTINP